MASDGSEYANENAGDITATLEITVVAAALFLALFESQRRRQPAVFWPKRRYSPARSPAEMPRGWVGAAAAVPGRALLPLVGLDAYMILRYTRICASMTALASLLGLVVLAPVFFSYRLQDDDAADDDGAAKVRFTSFTLSTVPQEHACLWAPVVVCYALTLHAIYLISREHGRFLRWRQQWLADTSVDNTGDDPDAKQVNAPRASERARISHAEDGSTPAARVGGRLHAVLRCRSNRVDRFKTHARASHPLTNARSPPPLARSPHRRSPSRRPAARAMTTAVRRATQ
jgi:hypothetical protein